MRKKLISLLCVFIMIPNLFIVSVKADSKNYDSYVELEGYIIDAKDAQDFIRYGELNNVKYNEVSWSINNLVLENGKLNIEVFDGKEDNIFSGDMLLSYNQMDGKNFVADISNQNYKTLYFNICEVNNFKHYLTDKVSGEASLAWYLKDEGGNLYVFETNTTLLDTLAEELSKITETARNEIDTLWFVYNTEPVSSTVEEETGWQEVSTYGLEPSSGYTVWKGNTYTETFYLSYTPIVTTCMPYVQVIAEENRVTGNGVKYNTNLYIDQNVTDNGVDVTGRVGNVFKLENICYKLGAVGNIMFYDKFESSKLRYSDNGSLTTGVLTSVAKHFVPKGVKTLAEITSLMNSVISSGTEGTFSTGMDTSQSSVFGGKINDKYYLSYDSEIYGDHVGVTTMVGTQDKSLKKETLAYIKLEWSFDIRGGSVDKTEKAEYTKIVMSNAD